eukprot:759170-Hanusia_phi.AAC.1
MQQCRLAGSKLEAWRTVLGRAEGGRRTEDGGERRGRREEGGGNLQCLTSPVSVMSTFTCPDTGVKEFASVPCESHEEGRSERESGFRTRWEEKRRRRKELFACRRFPAVELGPEFIHGDQNNLLLDYIKKHRPNVPLLVLSDDSGCEDDTEGEEEMGMTTTMMEMMTM